jgi:hypothetical protein
MEFEILSLVLAAASRVCTHHLLTTLQCPLAVDQVLVIKVIVPNGRTAVRKSTLLEGEPLVADAVRALSRLHEERKLIEVMLRLTVRFARFDFDVRLSLSPDVLLDAMTLDRLAFVA